MDQNTFDVWIAAIGAVQTVALAYIAYLAHRTHATVSAQREQLRVVAQAAGVADNNAMPEPPKSSRG